MTKFMLVVILSIDCADAYLIQALSWEDKTRNLCPNAVFERTWFWGLFAWIGCVTKVEMHWKQQLVILFIFYQCWCCWNNSGATIFQGLKKMALLLFACCSKCKRARCCAKFWSMVGMHVSVRYTVTKLYLRLMTIIMQQLLQHNSQFANDVFAQYLYICYIGELQEHY